MSAQTTHDVVPVPLPNRPRLRKLPDLPGTVNRITPRTAPAVGPAIPRTSDERPWDRVRFTAESRAGAEVFDEDAPPRPATEGSGPEADRIAAGIAQHAVESLMGMRSHAQLARWLAPALYEALARRVGLAARLQGRPQRALHVSVRAVSGCAPVPHAREVSVVVHDGTKVRAAAIRLETFRGRWRAVALEIG